MTKFEAQLANLYPVGKQIHGHVVVDAIMVYETKFAAMANVTVQKTDSGPSDICKYDVVLATSGAAVVAITPEGRLVLVRQVRVCMGGGVHNWEIPTETMRAGEEPADTALRGISEELGIEHTGQLTKLFEAHTYTRATCSTTVFLAHLATNPQGPFDPELTCVKSFSVGEVREMVSRGEITEATSLAGIFCFLEQQRSF